jgi:hypothetical protein
MNEVDFKRLIYANTAELRGHFDTAIQRVESSVADLRDEFGGLRGEFGGLRGEFGELRGEFAGLRTETRNDMAELRREFGELRGEFAGLRTETRNDIGELRGEFGDLRGEFGGLRGEFGDLRAHVDKTAAETRQEFAATARDMRHQYGLVTERLSDKIELVIETVALLDGKVDRIEQGLREEMRHGLADIHHLLRTAFLSLDRRVKSLEK